MSGIFLQNMGWFRTRAGFNCPSRCTRCGPTSPWPTFTMHHACKLSCTPQWFVTDMCFITAPHWWSFQCHFCFQDSWCQSLLFPPKRQRSPSLFRLVIGFVFKARVVRFLMAAPQKRQGLLASRGSLPRRRNRRDHDGTVVVIRSPDYLEMQRQSNQTSALLWSLFKVELCVPTDMVINLNLGKRSSQIQASPSPRSSQGTFYRIRVFQPPLPDVCCISAIWCSSI